MNSFFKQPHRVLLSIVGLLILFLLFRNVVNGGDFVVFLDAGAKLFAGVNIYEPPFAKGMQYFYSPMFAVLMYPLSGNFTVGCVIWQLLNVLFIFRSVQLILNYFNWEAIGKWQKFFLTLFVVLFVIRFVVHNANMVQMTMFLIWAIFEALRLFKGKYWILAGLILSLSINIKVLTIVVLPFLLYTGNWRGTTSTIIGLLIWFILPTLVVGWEGNIFLHSEWWRTINPDNPNFLQDGIDLYPHSLNALFVALFTDEKAHFEYRRHIIALDLTTFKLVLNAFTLVLVGLTLVFLKSKPFQRLRNEMDFLCVISYIMLLVPLIFPHQQKYAFCFILPAVIYIGYYLVQMRPVELIHLKNLFRFTMPLFFSFILVFFTSDDIIGRELNNLTQYFKLLTYGVLLLIPVLYYVPKSHVQKEK